MALGGLRALVANEMHNSHFRAGVDVAIAQIERALGVGNELHCEAE